MKEELLAKYADRIAPEDMKLLRDLMGFVDGKQEIERCPVCGWVLHDEEDGK